MVLAGLLQRRHPRSANNQSAKQSIDQTHPNKQNETKAKLQISICTGPRRYWRRMCRSRDTSIRRSWATGGGHLSGDAGRSVGESGCLSALLPLHSPTLTLAPTPTRALMLALTLTLSASTHTLRMVRTVCWCAGTWQGGAAGGGQCGASARNMFGVSADVV